VTVFKRLAPVIFDRYTLLLVAVVVVASLLPARGRFAGDVELIARAAIVLLFFLHGAKLPREAVVAGLAHWRLHLTVLAATFAAFPLIGLAVGPLATRMFDPSLYAGFLFLCCLPSTVQSSIAFTAMARGNVAAAVVAASASNLAGIVLTPLLTGLLLARQGAASMEAMETILLLLLVPFAAGQLARRWVAGWIGRHGWLVRLVDRGSILLMVYAAFGQAVVQGLWSRVSGGDIAGMVAVSALVLALILAVTRLACRIQGFSRADEVTVMLCGSKKSLATGVPMASMLFPAAMAGGIVLPLMIFHQLQLVVCAALARRWGARAETADPGAGG
jgi:sodium/bile acid cotransporter 7